MNVQELMFTLLLPAIFSLPVFADDPAVDPSDTETLAWQDDYAAAMRQAEQENKNVLIYFHAIESTDVDRTFEREVLVDPTLKGTLGRYMLVKLPVDATIKSGGKPYRLLDHPIFANVGRAGVAIINCVDKNPQRYQQVVGAFTLSGNRRAMQRQLAAIAARHLSVVSKRTESEPDSSLTPELHWHDDYREAMDSAQAKGQDLFVYFYHPVADRDRVTFETKILTDRAVRSRLANMTLVKLSLDVEIPIDGQRSDLIKHKSFRYMYGRQGFAIIDQSHPKAKHYQHVVSAHPFGGRHTYDARKLAIILDLPSGTITQRTLVYAVKIHPDAPRSTNGRLNRMLAREAQSQSLLQARLNNQGHHNWESRFHSISARLPSGVEPVEVCAESWPDEELVDAAIECVHSWRQSSGHWSAVRALQAFFGYDMKRGSNRIWYGTGIFGRR